MLHISVLNVNSYVHVTVVYNMMLAFAFSSFYLLVSLYYIMHLLLRA